MKIKNISAVAVGLLAAVGSVKAQINTGQLDGRQNSIITAVPFLMITPDARAGAMGDVGVATPDDMNAIHWNTSKLAFMEKDGGVSVSYTPWLRQLVPDVSLSYLSVYGKLNDKSTLAGSLRYFSLGEIQFTDIGGNSLGNYNPNELAVDLAYAQKLSNKFSVGVAFRYIYSNLAGGANLSASPITPGKSFAGDITAYYRDKTKYKGYKLNYGFGGAITNIGSKITYSNASQEFFIPINLRVGTYWQIEIDKYNSIALTGDLNKLLVPTPPVYAYDANGQVELNPDGSKKIAYGKDNDVPLVQGMIQSFSDAPGGWKEELAEINRSIAMEYWYDKQFALRAGYFHEPATKGNRKYMTMGVGLRYNVFQLDVAYLISFQQRNPLDNTLRFTLSFDFDAFKKQKEGDNNNNGGGGVFEAPAN
jgi:hypothetical protein